MLCILLSISSMLAACAPSPQKAAMPDVRPASGTTVQSSSESSLAVNGSAGADWSEAGVGHRLHPAPEPVLEPVAAAKTSAPRPRTDSPAEALGRRILSTAFVRVGPDGHLTVELRNGHVLVLREVTMGARDYCGVQVPGDQTRARYCGGYAEIAAARPGGAPTPDQPVSAASGPPEAAHGGAERK